MNNKEKLITGLLVLSIGFNFFSLQEVKEMKNHQREFAYENEVNRLRNDISSLQNNLRNIEKQNEWIQDTNFQVIKEKPNLNRIYLQGEWTFKELSNGQVPFLSLKENNNWKEIKLEKQNGLTYSTQLQLSPSQQNNYKYRIYSKGSLNKSTEVKSVPYEKYGLPLAEVTSASFGSNTKPEVRFEIACVLYPEEPPIKEMKPDKIFLEVVRNGKTEKTIPFSLNKSNKYRVKWTLKNKKNVNEYTLFTITKFKNGFEKRNRIELFEKWAEKLKRH